MWKISLASLLGIAILSSGASAGSIGRETGFDIPRFVSMRSSKANVRRGPTLDHKVDWVFEREGLPVVIRAEFGHWRLVEDVEGDGGWVHRALIAGKRTGLVVEPEVFVFSAPFETSSRVAVAKKGVIVDVAECQAEWCKISWKDVEGWMLSNDLWGVEKSQISP